MFKDLYCKLSTVVQNSTIVVELHFRTSAFRTTSVRTYTEHCSGGTGMHTCKFILPSSAMYDVPGTLYSYTMEYVVECIFEAASVKCEGPPFL